MTPFVIAVLTLAVTLAACGDVLLSRAMRARPPVRLRTARDVLDLLPLVVREPRVLLAVLCLAGYFGAYMASLTEAPVSVANPITATSMLFSSAWAATVMREKVDGRRALGILLIVAGCMLVGMSAGPPVTP